MRAGLIAYVLGIVLAAWTTRPEAGAGIALAALAAAGVFATVRLDRLGRLSWRWRAACLLLICAAAGFAWHLAWAGWRLDRQLDPSLEGVDMAVRGVVANLPRRFGEVQRFLFAIEASDSGFSRRKILLNHYGPEEIRAGRAYRLTIRLRRPRAMANPGVFDYEAWLFQRGVSARGYVRGDVEWLPEHRGNRLARLRAAVKAGILRQVADPSIAGVVVALVLGDSGGLSDVQWELFRQTGTNHLFVISGLHIGLVCLLAWSLGLALARCAPPLLLFAPAQKIALVPALAAGAAYAAISGFGLPAQRALVMAAVLMLASLFNRKQAVSLRFLLAMAVVLTLNPLSFLGMGFWLSFGAVAALLLIQRPGSRSVRSGSIRGWLGRGLRPQLAVAAMLFAPLLFFTGQASLLGPVVNLAAIPLVGLLIVPLCLSAACCLGFSEALASVLFNLARHLLRGLLRGLEQAVALGGAHALVAPPRLDTPSLLLLAVAGLLLLLPGGFPGRRMAGLLALPLLFAPPRLPRNDLLRLHVLDVGQGLAVVVETRRHVLLYDTGASFSPDASIGDRIVLPVLESLGIDKIDTLVLSHNDDDHSGGFAAIDAAMPIGRLYSSFGAVSSTGMAHACRDRIAWRWDGVAFRFLHPAAPVENDNDNSCVLQIRAGDFGALLPGDIEATVERELAGALGEELRGDVLIAAHHGSNTSSSWPFLKMVEPEHVVFAAGYRNAFGHPSPAVLERAAAFTPNLLNTSELGMIRFTLPVAGEPPQVESFRTKHPRYWRGPPQPSFHIPLRAE